MAKSWYKILKNRWNITASITLEKLSHLFLCDLAILTRSLDLSLVYREWCSKTISQTLPSVLCFVVFLPSRVWPRCLLTARSALSLNYSGNISCRKRYFSRPLLNIGLSQTSPCRSFSALRNPFLQFEWYRRATVFKVFSCFSMLHPAFIEFTAHRSWSCLTTWPTHCHFSSAACFATSITRWSFHFWSDLAGLCP